MEPIDNFFQSEAYLEFIKENSFLEPFKYTVTRDNKIVGAIEGYIDSNGGKLLKHFTQRAIINGGPFLSVDINKEELIQLLEKCKKGLKRKAIFIESRNFNDYSIWKDIFEASGYYYAPHYDFIIDTSSTDIVNQNLGKSRKRDVRTSLREGAIIQEANSIDDIIQYYNILSNLYKSKVKTPLFPLDFFIKLYSCNFCKFLLIWLNGVIIGGTVCILGNNKVYEWFACGKDGEHKDVHPSTLATYAGIKYAAENGFSCFDMMGAGSPGDGGYGVRDFKSKFGGNLVEYGRFRCILNRPLFYLGKLGVALLKNL